MEFDFTEFDDVFDKIKINKKVCCDNQTPNYDDGYELCLNCGAVNLDNQIFTINPHSDGYTYKKSMPYKRVIYFKQKLNMINNITMYKGNPKLIYFIDNNMKKNIKSIYKLKRVMKKVGLVKYYKYIYSIYHAITGKQLITIPMQDYPKYITQFKNIELIFKKNNIRHNLYSYNVIIYFLMRVNNNPDHKYLILPLNRNRLKKKIKEILNICGLYC
jgi:hypothetical protein